MYMTYLSISETLKQQREKANFSQEDLAQFFGTDAALIEKWESGLTEPTLSEALVLSKLYGCSLDDLLSQIDTRKMIPEKMLDSYECILLKNQMSRRWYD